ncbi:MAG: DNA/RNA non-specific endonuclease [Chitinophagaceae bacterium]
MPSITRGYDPEFTGITLKLPTMPAGVCAPLKQGTGEEIKYIHYSSFLHKERNLPLLCASNIKGESYNAPNRAGVEPWDYSDQVLNSYQLDEAFYGNDQNTFDRGHIVRRVDPCWGDAAVAAQAEIETFRWSNCTPQHKKLNQKGGVWYQLEQYVMENGAKGKVADLSVFAGPILSKDDKYMLLKKGKYKGQYIQIPIEFFKIIVWKKSDNKLYAVGFLMSQWEFIKNKVVDKPVPAKPVKKAVSKPRLKDDYFENLKFADHKTYQVPIAVIVEKTGIKFNWSHVIFPYKATDAQTIEAVPTSKKGLRAVRGTSANSAATKQYDLKNVTL